MIGCQWKATAMLTVGVQSARNLPVSSIMSSSVKSGQKHLPVVNSLINLSAHPKV